MVKQTATETSLGVKALLQRQPAAALAAPAAPAWPAQSYPQALAWAGKGGSGGCKGDVAKGKGWTGKGGWKRACWRCGSQEHLMGSCPIALVEKAVLVNFVAEPLGSFEYGGTDVFAAWEVVNQFTGKLAWSEAEECCAVSEYDIALAKKAAQRWVSGPNDSGDRQRQQQCTEAIGVGCKVTRRLTVARQNHSRKLTHLSRTVTGGGTDAALYCCTTERVHGDVPCGLTPHSCGCLSISRSLAAEAGSQAADTADTADIATATETAVPSSAETAAIAEDTH